MALINQNTSADLDKCRFSPPLVLTLIKQWRMSEDALQQRQNSSHPLCIWLLVLTLWSFHLQHGPRLLSIYDGIGALLLDSWLYNGHSLSFLSVIVNPRHSIFLFDRFLLTCNIVLSICVPVQVLPQRKLSRSGQHGEFHDVTKQSPYLGTLKPFLFPSRTSHSRFFPKKHSFSYSYLLVGIPVGWRGSIGNMLSSDVEPSSLNSLDSRRTWFEVLSEDHLARGKEEKGLRGKLDAYLRSQVK